MPDNAPLIRELSPHQSSHQGVLVKVSPPAHLVARKVVEVHNTSDVEKEPREILIMGEAIKQRVVAEIETRHRYSKIWNNYLWLGTCGNLDVKFSDRPGTK